MSIEYIDNQELGEELAGLEMEWYKLVVSNNGEFAKHGLNHPLYLKLSEVRKEAARRFQKHEEDGDKD